MVGPMNETPKYVVSTTLDKVEWQNSTLLEGESTAPVSLLYAVSWGAMSFGGTVRSTGDTQSTGTRRLP